MKYRKALAAVAVAIAAAGAPLLTAPTAGAAATANWWDGQMHTDDRDPGGRLSVSLGSSCKVSSSGASDEGNPWSNCRR